MAGTRQLMVVHLSDIHFGGGQHRFDPLPSPGGDEVAEEGFPTLLEKVVEDLDAQDPRCPVIVALTGDLGQKATYDEFKKAEALVLGLAETEILSTKRGLDSVFLVPGNHDVNFTSEDVGERWQQWTSFYNRLYGTSVDQNRPQDFAQVHDRVDDLGAVIVTLNSSIHVREGSPDEQRGRVDLRQVEAIDDALNEIDPERLRGSIRVALIHHHPVLIPDLVEAKRGYDAVLNSGFLIKMLRKHGFHLLLHGHKHSPHVFTQDSAPAYVAGEQRPILIAAGGSVGSKGLPESPRTGNCYNQIVVKWDPDAGQARIRVATRGLCLFDDDGSELLPARWSWNTQRVEDRQFLPGDRVPSPKGAKGRKFDAADDADEQSRGDEYARLGGHFPVVEVMQSLIAGQGYEARLWIVCHKEATRRVRRVTWSAGPFFPVVTVEATDDPNLCASMHYWGPVLFQAHMEFEEGDPEDSYVYARLPGELGVA